MLLAAASPLQSLRTKLRPVAGEDGGVARAGLRRRVRLVAGGEDHALGEAPHAAGIEAAIFGEEVGRILVDRDDDNELRPCAGRDAPLLGCGGRDGEGQQGGEQLQLH